MKKHEQAPPTNSLETAPHKFQEGNLITYPRDGTGAVWRVGKENPDGSLNLEIASHKTRPKSPDYPRKLIITLEAFHLWKKIS
jgi:hypothetical protein